MSNYYPSIRQLCEATLVGIASHPRIQNPRIYYPIRERNKPAEEIKIVKWRQGGGLEIMEGDLCCSVYPFFSPRSVIDGAPSQGNHKACVFEPYTLGGNFSPGEATSTATYNLVVELSYRDVAIDRVRKVKYAVAESVQEAFTPHYLNFAPDTSSSLALGGDIPGSFNKTEKTPTQTLRDIKELNRSAEEEFRASLPHQALSIRGAEIEVDINPAELILQDYMDLMRLVLGDISYIFPYRTKMTYVKEIDFPTSSWSQDNENLLFHMAYLIWEICLYPPSSWQQLKEFPQPVIQDLHFNLSTNMRE